MTRSSLAMTWLTHNWHRVLAHLGALAPLAWLLGDALSGGLTYTFNRTVMLRTGTMGLILLVASLACTPTSWLFGWPRLVQVRRALGLYGFTYIALHLLTYAALDNGFDLELIWRDLEERRAMSVGLAAFLALIPLALTSTRGWQKRLGRRWRILHRLVYLAAPLSVLHYLWLERDFITTPLIYAVIVGVLLGARWPPVRKAIAQLHRQTRPEENGDQVQVELARD